MDVEELIERRRKHRIQRIGVMLGTIVFVLGAVFIFKVRNIQVEGNTFYTEAEVASMICSHQLEKNMLTFWVENQFAGHKDLPFVREYKISYGWPGTIHIKLYEKTIVAGIQYMNEFIYFDKDGMVLESLKERHEEIPLFEIENMKNFALYQKIDMENQNLLDKILRIANLMEHYELTIERIVFDNQDDAILYSGKIKIYLGSGEHYDDAMAALNTALPAALNDDLSGEFDLTNFRMNDNIIFKQK